MKITSSIFQTVFSPTLYFAGGDGSGRKVDPAVAARRERVKQFYNRTLSPQENWKRTGTDSKTLRNDLLWWRSQSECPEHLKLPQKEPPAPRVNKKVQKTEATIQKVKAEFNPEESNEDNATRMNMSVSHLVKTLAFIRSQPDCPDSILARRQFENHIRVIPESRKSA